MPLVPSIDTYCNRIIKPWLAKVAGSCFNGALQPTPCFFDLDKSPCPFPHNNHQGFILSDHLYAHVQL